MATNPTFVVGVGQAGIKVMNFIAEAAEENDDRDDFEFVAIDTDVNMLNQRPDDALGLILDHDSAYVEEDVGEYPFFTENMKETIGDRGAMRRRPIGRYKLDSRGSDSYSELYDAVWDAAKSHYQTKAQEIKPDDGSFNIYFIHSLGGGTGSGTFPLLAAMLNELVDRLDETTNNVAMYLAGVGVAPLITFDPSVKDPQGDERYFPNTYAAMNDLDTFEELASNDDILEVKSYAQKLGGAASSDIAPSIEQFEMASPPFDDYWLFGVNEGKIQGGTTTTTGAESYAEMVDRTIARPLHAISKLDESAENWADSTPYIGSVDNGEMRVPHDMVLDYYEMQVEREENKTRLQEEIPDEIADLKERKRELETLKEDLDENAVQDPELLQTIRQRIEGEFPSGKNLVETKSPQDVKEVLEEIDEGHDIEGTLVATSVLLEKLHEERGLPAVEADRKDSITDLWTTYDMATRPKYGGETVTTVEGKAAGLEEFLRDKIDEYEEVVENWDPGLVGTIQDALPPFGPFESDREEAEKVLEKLRTSLEEVRRVEEEWGHVSDLRQAVEDHRTGLRERIDERMHDLDEQITDLQTERDELQRELEVLDDDIESTRRDLSAEKTSQRLGILPIETDKLDEIDPRNADEILTSIQKYVEEGLVSEEKFGYAVGQYVDNANAAKNRRVTKHDYDFDEHRRPSANSTNETWFLYHEDNEVFKDEIQTNVGGNTLSSGENNKLDYLSDPYRIEFVSFYRRGPVPGLTFYQQLQEMEENGYLDGYARQYEGVDSDRHRLAFAYLEWYSRWIKEAFEVDERIPVQRPPEMDHTRVQKPDLSEGEVKNWIRTNGLDSYIWSGVMMDDYDADENNTFTGWSEGFSGTESIGWTEITKATPSVDLKKQWLDGVADWDDILEAYVENIYNQTGGIMPVFEDD